MRIVSRTSGFDTGTGFACFTRCCKSSTIQCEVIAVLGLMSRGVALAATGKADHS